MDLAKSFTWKSHSRKKVDTPDGKKVLYAEKTIFSSTFPRIARVFRGEILSYFKTRINLPNKLYYNSRSCIQAISRDESRPATNQVL